MGVNYAIEAISLDDWELTHSLSATAYKVMRKLLYLASKERFPERISVSNTVLMSLVGCSEDSLIKARNQLIQAGLITYKGQKKVTPLYMIHYFCENPVYNHEIQGYERGIEQGYELGIEQGYERGIEQGTYIKEKEKEEDDVSAVRYFEKCGIALANAQFDAIRDFYEQGITDDMLRFAADEAVEYGARSFAYIRRVVDGWICAGIDTLEAAKARQAQFKRDQDAIKASRAARQRSDRQSAPSQMQAPAPRFFSERWDG